MGRDTITVTAAGDGGGGGGGGVLVLPSPDSHLSLFVHTFLVPWVTLARSMHSGLAQVNSEGISAAAIPYKGFSQSGTGVQHDICLSI